MSPHSAERPRAVRSALSRLTAPGPLLAAGLGVTTIAASLWFATANRALDSGSATVLYSFYFLVGTIGTGVLAGLEQEMTRTVARAHAAGRPVGAAVRGQLRQAAGLAAVTVVILAAASPLLVAHWLGHNWPLALALLAGLAATWASFLVRGVLAGCQDFRFYSLTLAVQGVATIVPSLVLTLVGSGHMLGYALVFALGPLVGAASGLPSSALRRSWRAVGVAESQPTASDDRLAGAEAQPVTAEPRAAGARVARADQADEPGAEAQPVIAEAQAAGARVALAEHDDEPGGSAREKLLLLTLATLLSQVLINAVPLIIGPRLAAGGAHGADLAKSLSSSMGLSRLALLCLFPLQAPLLPLLAAAAVRRDFREVRRKTGFLVGACLVAGVLGVGAVVAAGPWLLTAYLHVPTLLSRGFLSALALSTAFLMTAFVLQSAQVALNRHRVVFGAWLAGLVAMAVVFALPLAPLAAAGWAGIAGPLVVTVVAAVDVMFVTRSAPPVPAAGTGDAQPAPQPAPVAEGVRS
ncbi:MAG: hypothetical protein ACJ786_08030 [Catenulispora sp.]